jgi:hypothetical protein
VTITCYYLLAFAAGTAFGLWLHGVRRRVIAWRKARRDLANLKRLCMRRCGMPGPGDHCFPRREEWGGKTTNLSLCGFLWLPWRPRRTDKK